MVGLSSPLRPMIFFDRTGRVDRPGLWRRVARVRVGAMRARVRVCARGLDVPVLFPYHRARIDS